jgi:hypothetical protein
MLQQVRALRRLQAYATEKNQSLGESALELSESYRESLEKAWVSLLGANRRKEEAIRGAALFFENMGPAKRAYKGKIFAIAARADEIASEAGREFLRQEMSKYVDRPDPRQGRGFVVVQGWAGSPNNLNRLGRIVHDQRAVLVTDGPAFSTKDQLREASKDGGYLESIPGTETHKRHMIVLGNRGLAREGFRGKHAAEEGDVNVGLAAPWFGSYLDRIVQGEPWRPGVGYQNPIMGVEGVVLDLTLDDHEGTRLYGKHRINPCIRLSHGSKEIVVWGVDTLSKAGEGVQIGVGIVEMLVVRYAEWIVNKYGFGEDLEKAEDVVKGKLSRFVVENSGAGKMFRSGSSATVIANHETRELEINFNLRFREVAESATIRILKSTRDRGRGALEAASAN